MKFFSRTFIYYVITGLILFLILDVNKVRVNRLNYLKDSASYPVMFLDHKADFDQRQFHYAREYYQTLAQIIPYYEKSGTLNGPVTLSKALGMIALCDYYLGEHQKAAELFKKALESEPRHFWFDYNLGIVYFKAGDYSKARSQFEKVLLLNREKLDVVMRLDYYELWAPQMSGDYKKVNLVKFYYMINNSGRLAILAREEQKIDADFELMFPPSLYFVGIGQERFLVQKR